MLSGASCLVTYPRAPARRARAAYVSSSNMDRTMTLSWGRESRRRFTRLRPSSPGRQISMMARSGGHVSTAARAASTSPASAHTMTPGPCSRRRRIPCRTTGWSSTSRIEIRVAADPIAPSFMAKMPSLNGPLLMWLPPGTRCHRVETARSHRGKPDKGEGGRLGAGPRSVGGGLLLFDPADRVPYEFGGALEAQLLLDVRAVGLDGLHAEVEFLGDLARAEAVPDVPKDLQLAVA